MLLHVPVRCSRDPERDLVNGRRPQSRQVVNTTINELSPEEVQKLSRGMLPFGYRIRLVALINTHNQFCQGKSSK